MHYFLEAICIGIYTAILSICVPPKQDYFLFLLGFLKHGLGDVLGIHTFYCNIKLSQGNWISSRSVLQILCESIGEGVLFMIFGTMLMNSATVFVAYPWATAFMIGFSLHILFEWFSFHSLFLKYRCIERK